MRPLKIYDCFPFYNEVDLLRLRMAYLEDVVDGFVAVEAYQTHAGQPKPLYLAKEGPRDLREHPKLSMHAVDLPVGFSDWERDHHQRNSIGEALRARGVQPDDLVLVSDVDEIPAHSAIARAEEALAAARERTLLIFEQRLFYFRLNYELVWSRKMPWLGTAAARFAHMRSANGLRTTGRNTRGRHTQGFDREARVFRVPQAGWHFSYLGGDEFLRQKLAAHEEHSAKRRPAATVPELIERRMSLFPRKGLDEVWAVVEPREVGLPESAIARADIAKYFHAPCDPAADVLNRVREASVPRRLRLGRFDLGYLRRSPWPRLP
jgi:beta-1,4-mannosyl-glycoprotein beta-1,4-N-acetylglucosaminyltransferase